MEDVSENESSATKPRKRLPKWLRIALWTGLTVVILCCGIPIAAIPLALPHMRITRVERISIELQSGLVNYHAEFGHFPTGWRQTDGMDFITDTGPGNELLPLLMEGNPRGILFYWDYRTHQRGDLGLWYSFEAGPDDAELYDAWGNPFQVVLDTNGDGMIEVPNPGAKPGETIILNQKNAVWSYGPNGVPGKGEDSWDDDIYSYSVGKDSDE